MRIYSLNISDKKGEKYPINSVNIIKDYGIEGDFHAGRANSYQISLLDYESIFEFKLQPGKFGENITTKGLHLDSLKIGDKIKINQDVILEVCQIGKFCKEPCQIYKNIGNCIMQNKGIFLKVLKGGRANIGDKIEIL